MGSEGDIICLEAMQTELRQKVDHAFQNPISVTMIEVDNKIVTEESILNAYELQNAIITAIQNGDEFLQIPEIDCKRNNLFTTSPEGYFELVQFAYERFFKDYVPMLEDIKPMIESMLNNSLTMEQCITLFAKENTKNVVKHEFGHHEKALGIENISISYAINVLRDRKSQSIYLSPSIVLTGRVPLVVLKEVVANVDDPSVTDKIIFDSFKEH